MEEVSKNINTKEKKSKNIRKIIVLVTLLLVIIIGYVMYRGSYLQVLEIGEKYVTTFQNNIKNVALMYIANFVILYLCVYFETINVKNGLKPFFADDKKQVPKIPKKSIAFVIAIIGSFIATKLMCEKLTLFLNSTSFGVNDILFGCDLGFFVFKQPLIQYILGYLLTIVVGLVVYKIVYYIIIFNTYLDGVDSETLKNSKLIKQLLNSLIVLAILISLLILVNTQSISTNKFLTINENDQNFSFYGVGFTEATVKLWGYRIFALVIIVSTFLIVKNIKKKDTKKTLLSIFVVPTYLVGLLICLILVEVIYVNSNELDVELKYIKNNINSTRNAYGIKAEEISMKNNETIDENDIKENSNVVRNINLSNDDIILENLNLVQTVKKYYTYPNTQIGRYDIGGEDRLVYITPREIQTTGNTRTYKNKTYEYTHGIGVIINSASTVDESGNFEMVQKGFNESETLNIEEPRIYFGTETNETIVVNENSNIEFDYPTLDNIKTNTYTGEAGKKFNFIDRLILGLKTGNFKLTFVNSNSKIITNRNIIDRAKTVMPYLLYDENPYMVISDEGDMVWVLDAYTISNRYPSSQKTIIEVNGEKKEINYIKNSVKVLVDAYDGTMKFYITDRTDPIVMAYSNIYSDLFESAESKIPSSISKHFVYPEFLYNIQSEILKQYHNVEAEVLYRGDDIWDISKHYDAKSTIKEGIEIAPYYTFIKTVDENNSNLGLVLPYTLIGKQSMISYLVGTCDENGNNILKVYKYSEDTNVLGTIQLDTLIKQDDNISKEIQNLNTTGTKISKDIIVVPINDTLLYVEPIYQVYINEKNSLPLLKKIIVASGNKLAIGDTFESALQELISQNAVDIEIEQTDTIDGIIDTIIKANKNLEESKANGNWELVGKDLSKMQELINTLEGLQQKNKELLNEENNVVQNEEITTFDRVNALNNE